MEAHQYGGAFPDSAQRTFCGYPLRAKVGTAQPDTLAVKRAAVGAGKDLQEATDASWSDMLDPLQKSHTALFGPGRSEHAAEACGVDTRRASLVDLDEESLRGG